MQLAPRQRHLPGLYAAEMSWREDNRRLPNGAQYERIAGLSMKRGKPPIFVGTGNGTFDLKPNNVATDCGTVSNSVLRVSVRPFAAEFREIPAAHMPFVDDFQTLRESAGLRKAEVAQKAQISVDTITRIEKHKESTKETLVKAINALNDLHYNERSATLDYNKIITDRSRFGEGRDSKVGSQVVSLRNSDV